MAVIESNGATSLFQVGDGYFIGSPTGPQLSIGGSPVIAGAFYGWTPIAVEAMAGGGYQVIWKNGSQYTGWNADANGNYLSNSFGQVSANSYALESRETTFQQDLNGDSTIGPTTSVIEANGATNLVQVADRYSIGSPTGPQLSIGGSPVIAGAFYGWAPIAVEAMAGGYQVILKNASTGQYTGWNTDANGNYLSNSFGQVSGNSYALESRETTFQQDLNGDSTLGPINSTIEANGTTSLVQVADRYSIGSPTGPQLSIGGSPVIAGAFYGWAPIAVEAMAGGYQVILKNASTGQYTGWNTDANGNYLSNSFGQVSANSYALESLETTFQQDLNGDGTTGPTTTVIEANGATNLVQVVDRYFVGSSAGPQLSIGGSPVIAGAFYGWTPIAVEAMAGGGYQVIWKNGSQYTGWNADANGNYLSNSFGQVSANSYALESRETTFQQDLNGDGTTGPTTTVIEANGATSLVQVADRYSIGSPTGPQLSIGGSPVIAGAFYGWAPIAVEQTTTGYRVALKMAGADQYTVWNTDANGNYVSNAFGIVSGASAALQSLEPGFQQDLNGDHVIPSVTTVEANGSTSLVQIAGAYLLGGASGPQLSYGGSPVTVGGSWTPISAERTANGYAVAWKLSGVGEYTVWNTDAYGNYVSGTGVLFGQSSGLEAYEPFMHQDLNGDGTIGVPQSMFNISVNYSGDPNYRFVFDQAAARWEQVVTGLTNMPGYYDNVQISASVGPIDGPGRILGQAGPTFLQNGVPSAGIMQFDSADLASMYANGTLYYVILHEMGHVLGIGSLWNYDGLTSGSGYFGQNALNAYRLLTGNSSAASVPVETQGGQGTAGVHWSEAAFGNELMTGYIAGAPDPLSIVTVGSLQDLGYRVNYSAADPYSLPGYGGSAIQSSPLQTNALQASNSSGQPIGDVAVLTQSISSTFATSTSSATGITTMIPPPETLLAKPIA